MPLIGIWGQFPAIPGREGAVDTLEERINGCMKRSMNGRALPLDGREMKAFSSFMRSLSTGPPDGVKLIGAGTLQIKEPERAADPARREQVYAQV
jgi:thiosulfate dehydrogenase